MNEFKSLNKYSNKSIKASNNESKTIIYSTKKFISKILITLILFMMFLIGTKTNPLLSSYIYSNVYEKTFSFAAMNHWYKKNFGEMFPFISILPEDVSVFSEKLSYSSSNLYKNGVALKVSDKYLVPILNSGIVIYIGEKEDYGNTVIIQEESGLNVWYANINFKDVTIYDYLEKGAFLGEANGDTVYLLFQQDGKFLDYKKYI